MKSDCRKSREIIEILADVVKATAEGCVIVVSDYKGGVREMNCPTINYTFGNAMYVKEKLDTLSKTPHGNDIKYPLIALFCPFNEDRKSPEDYHTKAKVRVLIACASNKEWSNEERLDMSFKNILRPIYHRFLEALQEDKRLDFGYDPIVQHEYSENYSYGRYGAVTGSGEAVTDFIDAINITNLELKVKPSNCNYR